MQTFTHKERQYIESLLERNFKNGFTNCSEPLQRPMSAEERKLRSRTRKKCELYIYELAQAELAGVLPTKIMIRSKFSNASEAIDKLKWQLLFEDMKSVRA